MGQRHGQETVSVSAVPAAGKRERKCLTESGERFPLFFCTDFIIQVNIQLFSSYIKDSMKLQKARKTVNITTFFLDDGEERTQCTKH